VYRYCKISSGRSTPLEKSKVHPRTGYDGPVGKQMYSSTLSLTSALDEGRWSTPRPGRFTRGKENRCPLYSKLGGLQAGLDRCGKSRPPTGIRSPDRPARSESLHRLSCPGPHPIGVPVLNIFALQCHTAKSVWRSRSSRAVGSCCTAIVTLQCQQQQQQHLSLIQCDRLASLNCDVISAANCLTAIIRTARAANHVTLRH